ncbi:FAD-binding PCMH-type domain-containing protein [Favolaschia claudopus]|uniref:FAD-binding PCMH-type domain-containing protein n=1 Tax=Favolaschia claudopus TaxID=2862362 RepID=A0AAW0D436_9AGAR
MRLAPTLTLATLVSSALALDACFQIQKAVSSASAVSFPLELFGHYAQDISHWASSSTQDAACSVQPGTAEDVSTIVKGGGHTANPGFSSTKGVQISMARFSGVTYDEASGTATIGAGLIWDDVYAALEPHGVNVVGGRVSGVGVAGFTLGGGYSWKTNQFGLTIDTLTEYELVKPNGDIVSVTEASDADLFFALKGGMNNFGIVTKFTLKTFPQGGLMTFTFDQIDNNVTDPKAAILPTFNFLLGEVGVSHIMFYDGPTPPAGIFDDFLAIPHFTKDVSTRSFSSLVKASPSNATTGARGAFHTVSLLEYTPNMLNAILNESVFWGTHLAPFGATFISYDIEPFLSTLYTHSPPSSPSAYPPHPRPRLRLHPPQPLLRLDIAGAALYPNYALAGTPVARLYGGNLGRLREVKGGAGGSGRRDAVGGGGFKF